MAEEKKVNGKPEPEKEEKKEEGKEKKGIIKMVGEVVNDVKPAVGKGIKFLGKIAIGTVTVMSTIAAVAAIATPKKKYFTPNQNPSITGGQDGNVTGNSETVYHGEVQDI